ncbi:hypothetical protein H0I29_06440 [Polaribacter sp. R2A056_3_33]|uniref:hypothetical protein n=1 Tax=Polaribacter sp. R2A056_3_33 TaxID=2745563 RepID=UPI001C4E8A77|nr:hypothetical protein [Polaribacter sp. R2A056_3_33]QXP71713.1 hypothetical protein H0I29_06440 [Polaribacter sp. R2A056_3_33]
MKKVILAMVFIFATGTVMNASTESSINNLYVEPAEDCAGQSLNMYNFLEAFTGDWEYAFELSEAQLTECLNNAGY